jgi:hypothetical protein
MKMSKVAVWGGGETAVALVNAIERQAGMRLATTIPSSEGEDALMASEANCVILTPSLALSEHAATSLVCRLLSAGKSVVSLIPIYGLDGADSAVAAALETSCREGRAALHVTGLFPHLLFDRIALVLSRALTSVEDIRIVQHIEISALPGDLAAQLARSGISATTMQPQIETRRKMFANAAPGLICSLTGRPPIRLTTQSSLSVIKAEGDAHASAGTSRPDRIDSIKLVHEANADDMLRVTYEEIWIVDASKTSSGDAFLFGKSCGPYSFSVHVNGKPSRLDTQIDLGTAEQPGHNPLSYALAKHVISAIPSVCNADPGIVLRDALPRFQLDSRLPRTRHAGAAHKVARRKRIVIWGPGEVGGAVARAAFSRKDIEVVGAKVFSPHKHGRDLGELVGTAPIGVKATLSTDEILALKPDCIVMAPHPRAIAEGLDQDVMLLLNSGINVITSAAYHNVSQKNWNASAQSPAALLREVSNTRGIARNRRESFALSLLNAGVSFMDSAPTTRVVTPLVNKILKPALRKYIRATPSAIQSACEVGNASLHGTGVHPTLMAERVAMSLAALVEDVRHVRFIEACDFSYTPDGMWGGLNVLGFGRPVDEIDRKFVIARVGDLYYGDVIGNVAHILYGLSNDQVRVERSFRALPAERDFKVGSTVIRKGTAAALHMVHKGYVGENHFFTNEECWYLGPERVFRGDHLPFGNFKTPISYTVEVASAVQKASMQLSMAGTGRINELMNDATAANATADQRCATGQQVRAEGLTNPITNATAMAVLDAIVPICDIEAGVVIDDVRPGYRSYAFGPEFGRALL